MSPVVARRTVRFSRSVRCSRTALVLAVLALAAGPAAALAQGHFPTDADARLMLRYLVEDGETPGIVLAFLEADGSTRVLHYGDAGPGTRALSPRSVFEIGSITKTFTAALLADMVARGEMSLDDPVQKYLPEGVTMPTWEGREITLMDLSTHHSGLPRMPDNFDPDDPTNPYADYGSEDLYAFLSGHELRREPGSEYEYSNLAVGLLGHVLELATGRSYEDLVRERILEPLGMTTTGVTLRGDLAEWMTKGHDGAGEVVPYWDVTALVGAGGLRSNAEDMLKYLAAQLGPPESPIERALRLTHEPRVRRADDVASGLGWGIRELDGGRRILTHGGGTGGYRTMVGFDPVAGVGIVMLTNTGAFGDDLGSDLLRRGAPISTPTVEVSRELLESYVGVYSPAPGTRVAVRLEDEGWLTVQVPENVRFRMYATSDSTFYVRRTPWRFTFRRDETGRVTGMVADLEGTERQLARQDGEIPDPRVLAGNPLPADELPRLTARELARYEGRYTVNMGDQLNFRVFVEGGELRAQPEGQRPSRLIHQGGHTFVAAADTDISVTFILEDGRAERITVRDGRESAGGRRLAPGEEPPPPPAPDVRDLPLTDDDIARYEGTYLLELGVRVLELRIFGRDGRLISRAAGQNEAPLRFQGDHTFVPDFDDRVRLVFTVEDGRATRVTLHQGGGVFHGDREG